MPPKSQRGSDTSQWSPVQVEREIMGLSEALEDGTAELREMAEAMARAEHAYKVSFARELLKAKAAPGNGRGGITTDSEAEARARLNCDAEYLDHLVTEAKHGAQVETLRSMRASIDALRTIAANIREQTRG